MKLKNTDENKEAFLANYLHNPIINVKTGHIVEKQHFNFNQCMSKDNDIRPILKDLKNLSIDEILEIINILDPTLKLPELGEKDLQLLKETFYQPFVDLTFEVGENDISPIRVCNAIDHLRQNGYVTYFRGISPDEMYNFGWFITEELVAELKINEK